MTHSKDTSYGKVTCICGPESPADHWSNCPFFLISEIDRLKTLNAEMLEVLDAVLTAWHSDDSNFYREEPEYLERIRAALTKAEGK